MIIISYLINIKFTTPSQMTKKLRMIRITKRKLHKEMQKVRRNTQAVSF
jgi:hypothetical protein